MKLVVFMNLCELGQTPHFQREQVVAVVYVL